MIFAKEFNLELLTQLCRIAPNLTSDYGKLNVLDEEDCEFDIGDLAGELLQQLVRSEGGLIWYCHHCAEFASNLHPCLHKCPIPFEG